MNKEKFTNLSWEEINKELISACSEGNIEKIDYLLNSKELKRNPDLNYKDGEPILAACFKNHVKVIKYILTAPELDKKFDVHSDQDALFISLCVLKKHDILKYLIEEFNIEETQDIKQYLRKSNDSLVSNMFLNRTLKSDLPNLTHKEKRIKI